MPNLIEMNHFEAMAAFAVLASVGIGMLARRTTRGRLRYALWSFAFFILVSIGIAWLMYPFSR